MKKLLIPIILIIISFQTFSQNKYFDLSKYKLPEIKRHQLDFKLRSTGFYYSTKYTDSDYLDGGNYQDVRKLFSGQGEVDYSFYHNSDKFQTKLNTRTSIRYNKESEEEDGSNSNYERSEYENHLSVNYDVKYFPGHNNWFLSLIPDVELSYSKDKNFVANDYEKITNFETSIGIGGGKGRIEQVQDFRHAILLLQVLEERGAIRKNISKKDAYKLATIISELKNKRVFDSRIRKIADLTAVDSFLVSNGIIEEKNNIAYFVGLEDIWQYGSLQIRESGEQIKYTISPGYRSYKAVLENNRKLHFFDLGSSIEYLIYKPISIKWQTNYKIGAQHIFTNKATEENISGRNSKHLTKLFTNAELEFFPNTRTSLSLNGSYELRNNSDKDLFDNGNFQYILNINASASYYFSERLTISATVYSYISENGIFNDDIQNYSHAHSGFNLGLNYSIF